MKTQIDDLKHYLQQVNKKIDYNRQELNELLEERDFIISTINNLN